MGQTRATCETCKWWDNERGEIGLCRRYPPKLGEDYYAEYPLTNMSEWCGEHTPVEVGVPWEDLPA